MSQEYLYVILRFGVVLGMWLFVLLLLWAMRRDLRPRRFVGKVAAESAPVLSGNGAVSDTGAVRPRVAFAPVATGLAAENRGELNPADAIKAQTEKGIRREGSPRYLVFIAGPLAGYRVPLDGLSEITLGRAEENSLTLDDTYVSGRHARLYRAGENWRLEDLKSTNGTLLDGQKLAGSAPFPFGARAQIGQSVMELSA